MTTTYISSLFDYWLFSPLQALALCTSRAKRAISEGHLSMGTVRTYGKNFSFMPSCSKGTSFTRLYQLRVPDSLLEKHTFEVMQNFGSFGAPRAQNLRLISDQGMPLVNV